MSPTSPTQIAHVVLATHRYDEMIRFYEAVFGSTIQVQTDRLCFLTYDDEHHRHAIINLGPGPAETGEAPSDSGAGVAHVAYTWPGLTELVDLYRRMRDDLGRPPVRCLRHGPTLSMYFADPDGNRFEAQVDLLGPEEANRFMRSPAFAANPVGEPFDPEELVARFDAGGPLDDLMFRSDQEIPATGG